MKKKIVMGFSALTIILCVGFSYVTLHASIPIEDKNTLRIKTTALQNISYEKFKLKNGLSVYVIHDPDARESAVSLSVGVGSWDNPTKWPGMAHFLEHMLFMGSGKYPDEKEYMQYIADYSGTTNAYTASDKTVYMFKIAHEGLTGAIKRFSRFFIDPLFNVSGLKGELRNVDQEFKMALESDAHRVYYVFCETQDPQHPHSTFSCGNSKTLSKIPREDMLQWYKEYYGADKMHLVVYTPMSRDALKSLIEEEFSPILHSTKKSKTITAPFFSVQKQLGKMLYIESLKDEHNLSIEIPVVHNAFEKGSEWYYHFLSNLIYSKEPGSLYDKLDQKGWIFSLSSAINRHSKRYNTYTIDVALTNEGRKHVEEMPQLCKNYITYLAESDALKPLYEQFIQLEKTNFEYQNRRNAFSLVEQCSSALLYYPLEGYPSNMYHFPEYNQDAFSTIAKEIAESNALHIYTAPKNTSEYTTNLVEKYLKVPYGIFKQKCESKECFSFSIPNTNPYAPKSFNLVDKTNHPTTFIKDDSTDLVYVKESVFKTPHIYCSLEINSPFCTNDPINMVNIDIFGHILFEIKKKKTISRAAEAGLYFSTNLNRNGIQLRITGFDAHYKAFLSDLIGGIKNTQFSEKEFSKAKEDLLQTYKASTKSAPFRCAYSAVATYLENRPSVEDRIKTLDKLSYTDFISASQHILEDVYIKGLLVGNAPQSDLEELHQFLNQNLVINKHPPKTHASSLPRLISSPKKMDVKSSFSPDVAVLVLQSPDRSIKNIASHKIFSEIMREAFFDSLRTKQQTGYVAASIMGPHMEILSQYFLVQSTTHSADDLLNRFKIFIEEFRKNLTVNIPPERFNITKNALVSTGKKYTSLSEFGEKTFFRYVYLNDLKFGMKYQEALKGLQYEEFVTYVDSLLSSKNKHQLSYLQRGTGTN